MTSVAFSPDGHRIVSGSDDNTVRLWDAATGQPIGQPLTGHNAPVASVAFSPDGKRIVSGSDDHTLRLWPMFPDPASAMCAKLTTNMSHTAVARLGLTRHRLHQGLPGPPDRAGLASLPKPAACRARMTFVPWSAGHRKCRTLLTERVYTDSRLVSNQTSYESLESQSQYSGDS